MKTRTLGRTGWAVSEIACGTYRSFDERGRAGQSRVDGLVETNLQCGVNLFDTAPMYGEAERTLGDALARSGNGSRPGSPHIATKVLQHDLPGAKRQIENSFRLLGRIDLLQIHNMAGWREVLPYLDELKVQGRIRATGVTHYDPSAFGDMEAACRTGLADVIQIPLNLMEREAEQRLLPLAREMNLGILVMTPIQPLFQRTALLGRLSGANLGALTGHGVSDAGSLALKYLLSRHEDVILLPATSRTERIRSNAAVSDPPALDARTLADLEREFGS